jgi:nucleosome binding factor SPN SPT16 subunit
LAYPPVIQSGGLYDLTGGVVISTHDLLKPDCIIVQLGVKHQGYHANCIRTLLITPDAEARVVYTSLLTSF